MINFTMKDKDRFERIESGEITAIIVTATEPNKDPKFIDYDEEILINGSFKCRSTTSNFLLPEYEFCNYLSCEELAAEIFEKLGISSRAEFDDILSECSKECLSFGVWVVDIEAADED